MDTILLFITFLNKLVLYSVFEACLLFCLIICIRLFEDKMIQSSSNKQPRLDLVAQIDGKTEKVEIPQYSLRYLYSSTQNSFLN